MMLWEICQLCGKQRKIETNDPPKRTLSGHIWKTYKLGEFDIEHPYEGYEINICGNCLDDLPFEVDSYLVSNTEKAHDIHYHWDELKERILKSLNTKGTGVDGCFNTVKLELDCRPEAKKVLFTFINHDGKVIHGIADELVMTKESPRS